MSNKPLHFCCRRRTKMVLWSKKKKIPKNGVDKISELPDSLLIHILSLLDNMKDSVKTSLLSKRWKNLWTNLDTLVFRFDIENPSTNNLKQFMFFVDNTLMQCTCPKIKKLCISAHGFDRKFAPFVIKIVDKVVDFVIEKNVEDVEMRLKGLDYKIPVRFFSSSSFVSLEIDDVGRRYYYECLEEMASLVSLKRCRGAGHRSYSKTFDVSWKMLKCLSLKRVYVKKEFLAEMLGGCPVLETMVLDAVGGLNVIDIKSPSLRELKVLNFAYNEDDVDECASLDIIAPWVERLEVSGCFDMVECNLVSVPSLKCACLNLNYTTFDHVMYPESEDDDNSEFDEDNSDDASSEDESDVDDSDIESDEYESDVDDSDNESDEYESDDNVSHDEDSCNDSEDNSDNESDEDDSDYESGEEESDNDSDNSSDEVDSDNDSYEDGSDSESEEDEEHDGSPEKVWLNMISGLLKPVCNVEKFVVGAELLQALSMSKLLDGDFPIFRCKDVTLQSPICMHEVPGIVGLIESSPYMETLVIKLIPWQCSQIHEEHYTKYMEKVFSSFSGVDYLSEQKGTFLCLKKVTIYCTEKPYSCCDEDESNENKLFDFELKVVAHIIRNTTVLEKIVIFSDCSGCATRYIQLMSSECEIGDKAAGWVLTKRKSAYEFRF